LIDNDWKDINKENNFIKDCQIQSLAFKSNDQINYRENNCDIYFNITLKGASAFWLVLRPNSSKYHSTAVLKFYKDYKSQKVFVTFGRYIYNTINNLHFYKVFLKQQLINYNKKKQALKFMDNDIVELRGNILDFGDNDILAKIYLNDSRIENKIIGKQFNKFEDKSPVIFSGYGNSCTIKSFFLKNCPKSLEDQSFSKLINNVNDKNIVNNNNNENRHFECCLVF